MKDEDRLVRYRIEATDSGKILVIECGAISALNEPICEISPGQTDLMMERAEQIVAALNNDPLRSKLEALRELGEKATRGEWVATGRYLGTKNHLSYVGEVRDENGNWSDSSKSTGDAAFIVAAANLIREILGETPDA